jgi:hypothetical protein
MSPLFYSNFPSGDRTAQPEPGRQLAKRLQIGLGMALPSLLVACGRPAQLPVELSFTVQPTGQPGVYRIAGSTNLPNQSRLSVKGIRYLRPISDPSDPAAEPPNYSILAKQVVEVSGNQWETTLNLWQPDGAGQRREAWQTAGMRDAFSASDQVSFMATFQPVEQSQEAQQSFKDQRLALEGSLLRLNPTGQAYLQAVQNLSISVPMGKTLASNEPRNEWGDRAMLKSNIGPSGESAPPPKTPQSDAPLPTSAFFR